MFDVWKAMNFDFNHKQSILKSILLRKEKNQLNYAIIAWKSITYQTKQNLKFNFYINEMSEQQYLQSVFSSFRSVTVSEKHKRLKTMRKIWEVLRSDTKTQKHFKLCETKLESHQLRIQQNLKQQVLRCFKINAQIEKSNLYEEGVQQHAP